jgi:hypothetical protein
MRFHPPKLGRIIVAGREPVGPLSLQGDRLFSKVNRKVRPGGMVKALAAVKSLASTIEVR